MEIERPAEPAGADHRHRAAARCATDIPIPAAPYLDRKVRDVPHLAEIWSYINPFMLYGRHLGYKGNFEKNLAEHERQGARTLPQDGRGEAGSRAVHEGEGGVAVLRSRARRQRHPPVRAGRDRAPLHTFHFGRQRRDEGLCLSDYILDPEDGARDHLAMFVVTAGAGIRERSEELEAGRRSTSRRTPCRRWRSRRPKAAPNGCTAASARIGAFPIRPP